jgi:hypothetical protein
MHIDAPPSTLALSTSRNVTSSGTLTSLDFPDGNLNMKLQVHATAD